VWKKKANVNLTLITTKHYGNIHNRKKTQGNQPTRCGG